MLAVQEELTLDAIQDVGDGGEFPPCKGKFISRYKQIALTYFLTATIEPTVQDILDYAPLGGTVSYNQLISWRKEDRWHEQRDAVVAGWTEKIIKAVGGRLLNNHIRTMDDLDVIQQELIKKLKPQKCRYVPGPFQSQLSGIPIVLCELCGLDKDHQNHFDPYAKMSVNDQFKNLDKVLAQQIKLEQNMTGLQPLVEATQASSREKDVTPTTSESVTSEDFSKEEVRSMAAMVLRNRMVSAEKETETTE